MKVDMNELIENETNKYAKEFYEIVYNRGYSLIEGNQYKTVRDSVQLLCPKGHLYNARPDRFKTGTGCAKCANVKQRKTTQEFQREVEQLSGKSFRVESEYVNGYTQIKMKHLECSYEWEITPTGFLQNGKCPKCSNYKNRKKSQEEFDNQIKKLTNGTFKVVGKYINDASNVVLKHNDCGKTFKIKANHFLTVQQKCPYCHITNSVGEDMVQSVLDNNDLNYTKEKTFKGLRYKNLLRYDFYLPDYNLIIEFDGVHHFEPRTFGGISKQQAKENFKEQQVKDSIKNKYAKNNSINLLRIPYWDIDKVDFLIGKKIGELEALIYEQKIA